MCDKRFEGKKIKILSKLKQIQEKRFLLSFDTQLKWLSQT